MVLFTEHSGRVKIEWRLPYQFPFQLLTSQGQEGDRTGTLGRLFSLELHLFS